MVTVKTDNRRRVQLPSAKPGQIFVFQDNGDNTITLTKVTVERKEAFPPGSLAKHVAAWNKRMAPIARAMKVPPPPKDWD